MWKLGTVLAAAILLGIPALVSASEGLDVPDALERTVSLEGLTGISLFFARAYNDNLWLYATYCTAAMAIVGMVIALVTERILSAVGMEVEAITHKE